MMMMYVIIIKSKNYPRNRPWSAMGYEILGIHIV
jgi:hypothetical protein